MRGAGCGVYGLLTRPLALPLCAWMRVGRSKEESLVTIAGTCDPVRSLPAPRLRVVPYTGSFMQRLTQDDTALALRAMNTPAPWDEGEDDEALARAALARRWWAVRWQWYDPEILMGMRRRLSEGVRVGVAEVVRRMRVDERRHNAAVRAELAAVLDRLDAAAFRAGVESAVTRTLGRQFYRSRSVAGVLRALRATL